MRTRYFILVLLLVACTHHAKPQDVDCRLLEEQDLAKPGVLIVGDSISEGYTPRVRELLKNYSVVHSLCNDQSSTFGLAHIAGWLEGRKRWSMVTFNHGYWDMETKPEHASVDVYAKNLRAEAAKIQARADHVIFFTTPPVSSSFTHFPNQTVDEYNRAAVAVMKELNIPVYDLHLAAAPVANARMTTDNPLHFTEMGYRSLGDFVAQSILSELKR